MNPADEKAMKQAIEVAERQIAEIDEKLAEARKLSERRIALLAYIAHGRNLLNENVEKKMPASLNSLARQLSERTYSGQRPIWADAAPILAKAQRPLTVPEIVEGMKVSGRAFEAEHVTEVVRAALNRRPDVFENIGKGRYVMKTWPAEWKKRT